VTETKTFKVGLDQIKIVLRDGVAPVSPYSLLLCENIPDLSGKRVADVGTGSGILAITACLRGADKVFLVERYDKAMVLALENGKQNGMRDRFVPLVPSTTILPLPGNETVDVILSNPAQLPAPHQDQEHSPFYAGPEGRSMIDAIIEEAPKKLRHLGRLLMTHSSRANLPKTVSALEEFGFQTRILAQRTIPLRASVNIGWLDELGGQEAGLYSLQNAVAHETICVLEAHSRR
jgi:release factor glutamine methyltransferase